MTPTLSPNTQAILLVTAPLIAGRGTPSSDLLSPGEYKQFARHLRDLQRQPEDLLSPGAADLIRACQPLVDETRLQRLLGRGFLLSQVVERWQARAIWVVSRADANYPRRLKVRLKEDAPAVLYGCGDMDLLESGGLAVVGSREVDDILLAYTKYVGRLAANAEKTIISGGARGIDQAAMLGALEQGGKVVGILADSLETSAMNRVNRDVIINRQLALISPYDPSAGFNIGNAMRRNRLIYGLADAALVVNSDFKKGGTWAGATEQLDKLQMVPLFVRSTGEISEGLTALREKGAAPWPEPQDAQSLLNVFSAGNCLRSADPATVAPAAEGRSPHKLPVTEKSKRRLQGRKTRASAAPDGSADGLLKAARASIEQLLVAPMKTDEVAAALDIPTAQARFLLQRLVEEGVLEKQTKPVLYVARQSRLFD